MSAPPAPAAVSPEELLHWADWLLTSPVDGLGNLWPRACALIIRLALEQSLDRFWALVLPEAAECGMRQQLLLLPLYASGPAEESDSDDFDADLDASALAREAWRGLARAAHHHVYELAPTAAELRQWHTAVSQLTVLLNGLGPGDGLRCLAARPRSGPESQVGGDNDGQIADVDQ